MPIQEAINFTGLMRAVWMAKQNVSLEMFQMVAVLRTRGVFNE
jgi:hypothetical protein